MRFASPAVFAAVVAGVYATSLAVGGQLQHLDRASVVAIGLAEDFGQILRGHE